MKSFLLAIQFLTIIPIRITQIDKKSLSWSLAYFPLTGLLLGLGAVAINNFLSLLDLPVLSINIILVVFSVFITAGLHLDGLADTFDAISCAKDKEKVLAIMRDPHIGAMGVSSIVCILLLKISLLYPFESQSRIIALVLMYTISRWSMLLPILIFPYARQEGKAKIYMEGMNLGIFVISTLITISIVSFIWGLNGLMVLGSIAGASYLLGKFFCKKIGGITGDSLGTINEIAEVLVLLVINIMLRFS